MPLKLIEEIRLEHHLIDRVAGALFNFATQAQTAGVVSEEATVFVRFLRVFVGGFHHQREEETLFQTLVNRAEIPGDRGPLPVIVNEHREAAALTDELESSLGDREALAHVSPRLARHLWEHLDKENSVLLPESEQRLLRNGVTRLEGRAPTQEEEIAHVLGERLCERFPPVEDVEMVRGDGCVACSAFSVSCHGIEMEWWNHWDSAHYRSIDDG